MPNYVNANDVGAFLALDVSDANILEDVNNLIAIAEDVVDSYLEVSYKPQTLSLFLDGDGTEFIPLTLPLRSLTSLQSVDSEGAVEHSYEVSKVFLGPNNPTVGLYRYLELRDSNKFPTGPGSVKVTGEFGYADLASVPQTFKLGVLYTIKALMDSRIKDTFTHHFRGQENTVIYNKVVEIVPMFAQQLFKNYKILNSDLRL